MRDWKEWESIAAFAIPWVFGLSLGLLGTVLILDDNIEAFSAFLERHHWVLYISAVPLLTYIATAGVVCVFAILQYLFEKYHELRSEGYGAGKSLSYVLIVFLLIAALMYLFR